MKRAFRTIMSAAGVASACYLLAIATWDQVLWLFASVSLGWCFFVWHSGRRRAEFGPRYVARRSPELFDSLVAPKRANDWSSPPRASEMLGIVAQTRGSDVFAARRPFTQTGPRPELPGLDRCAQPRTIYKFPIHKLASAPQRLEPVEQ